MADVPIDDRPRERLWRQGAAALSDAEIVAVQLGSGRAGASAVDVAQRLLADWGGMRGLAGARPQELAKAPGVGPAKAARLASAFAVASRLHGPTTWPTLTTPADIAREAAALIGQSRVEQVVVLVCDGANRLKRAEIIATGSAKACPMPVREILSTVLLYDGVAFAVAHNHPGGDATPTSADVRTTRQLSDASSTVGLRLLSHVIVTGADWRSVLGPAPADHAEPRSDR